MVITKWNNEIQAAVIQEWTEGCQKAKGRQALRVLRKRIAEKYGLTMGVVKGIVELSATEGMIQNPCDYGKTYEPINYHQLTADLKERVRGLERKFEFLLDGVEKVLEDGETMGIHIANLRQMGKWMKKRDALDMEEMTRASPDENESPPPLEIESQNSIDNRIPGSAKRKRKGDPPRTTLEKIDRLRTQADNARKRGELLFRGIEEGKKAIPR